MSQSGIGHLLASPTAPTTAPTTALLTYIRGSMRTPLWILLKLHTQSTYRQGATSSIAKLTLPIGSNFSEPPAPSPLT